MSGPLQADAIRIGSSAVSAAPAGFSVGNSAVFNDDDSEYLTRDNAANSTTGGTDARKKFTVSLWWKHGNIPSGGQNLFIQRNSSANYMKCAIAGSGGNEGALQFFGVTLGAFSTGDTSAVLRDPHAWYHILFYYDSTDSTAGDRARIYLNGTRLTDFQTSATNPSSGAITQFGSNNPMVIGQNQGASGYSDGYMAEMVVIDGQALEPSSFTETDSNGVLRPLDISAQTGLTFGDQGFYLPMTTANGLGQDYSGVSTTIIAQQNTYVGTSNVHSGDADPIKQVLIADFSAKIPKIDFFARQYDWSGVTVRIETNTGSSPGNSTGTLVDSNAEITNVSGSNNGYVTATFPNGGPEVVAGTQYWIVVTGGQFGFAALSPAGTSVGQVGYYQGSSYSSTVGISHRVHFTGNHFMSRSPTSGAAGYTSHGPTQSSDSPTSNFATLSTIDRSPAIFSNGNLQVTSSTSNSYRGGTSTIGLPPGSGKWYVEAKTNGGSLGGNKEYGFGAVTNATDKGQSGYFPGSYGGGTEFGYYSGSGGIIYNDPNSAVGSVGAYGSGTVDTVALRFDMDASSPTCKFYVNNSLRHTSNLTVGLTYFPHFNIQDSSLAWTVNFGATAFTYSLPTDHLAISAANMFTRTSPTIEDGTAYHQSRVWQGNTTARKITQDGNSKFKPDFLWGKNRDNGGYSFRLFDAVRGNSKLLQLGGTSGLDAESTDTNGQTDFEVDGFDIGNGVHLNDSGDSIVGWQWLGANGTATPSGSSYISNLTVSANTTSGFSVGTFTAGSSGNNGVVAHGLGGQADWIVVKPLDSSAEGNVWVVWHSGINSTTGNTTRTFLNDDAINGSGAARINAAGTTTFTINDDAFFHGRNHSFLAWRAIPGFSAFGSYTGNGSASDGPLIEFGFSASWVLFKRVSGSDASWAIYDNKRDTFNPAQRMLLADSAAGDNVGNKIDFLANGVKIRGNSGAYNGSGNTYIFSAFAEHPFAATTPATAR